MRHRLVNSFWMSILKRKRPKLKKTIGRSVVSAIEKVVDAGMSIIKTSFSFSACSKLIFEVFAKHSIGGIFPRRRPSG